MKWWDFFGDSFNGVHAYCLRREPCNIRKWRRSVRGDDITQVQPDVRLLCVPVPDEVEQEATGIGAVAHAFDGIDRVIEFRSRRIHFDRHVKAMFPEYLFHLFRIVLCAR